MKEDDWNGSDMTSLELWHAAQTGNIRLAKRLIADGSDVNAVNVDIKPDATMTEIELTATTPLLIAIRKGHLAVVSLLIRHGVDVNQAAHSHDWKTPLIIAMHMGNFRLVAQLLHAGTNVPDADFLTRLLNKMQFSEGFEECDDKCPNIDYDKAIELVVNRTHLNVQNLLNSPEYKQAIEAEHDSDFHQALLLLRSLPSSCDSLQLKLDMERVIEAIYGVKGCDAKISIWNQISTNRQPKYLQFYAQTQLGRKIYIHGGVDFITMQEFPSSDELWAFDIDTRLWARMKTSGSKCKPGPRTGHTMFSYQNHLYMWGGKGPSGVVDTKVLHRFCITSDSDNKGEWEVVKVKGSSSLCPPRREEYASVFYKGKFYISGGEIDNAHSSMEFVYRYVVTDDLWCLNMKKMKWTCLKKIPIKRKNHSMWAANGKIYLLGGVTLIYPPNPFSGEPVITRGLENLHFYYIERNEWHPLKIIGETPYKVAEATILPLFYDTQSEDQYDEPSSILLFGGYTELSNHDPEERETRSKKVLVEKFGEEDWQDFCLPYRNRLLRFDIDTECWTLLKSMSSLLPKAQCLAAEVETKNGVTKLLIGRGYGLPFDSGKKNTNDSECNKIVALPNMYEVCISDTRDICCARDDLLGKGWAWDFFDISPERIPKCEIMIHPESPTLHHLIDYTFEDFWNPRLGEKYANFGAESSMGDCISKDFQNIEPNDESTLMGVRVKLHGLKGRKDLNDQVGRCGRWLKGQERYEVFLPCYERGGPISISAKASNIAIADPVNVDQISKLISRCNDQHLERISGNDDESVPMTLKFPKIMMSLAIPNDAMKKQGPLTFLFDDLIDKPHELQISSDQYYGPVSRKAQVVLRAFAGKNSICQDSTCTVFITETRDEKEKLFLDFYAQLREIDTLRVRQYEQDLRKRSQQNLSHGDKKQDWLKIKVTLDGIAPPITREIVVSPNFNLQNLHHQVLCPAIGWTSNYHCYAFRRIYDRCWIGPKKSTALDAMFQPLYIGGALANDEKITLRDLFVPNEHGCMEMQYVHDFGDWWSHTILVSKYEGVLPSNVSVAHLLSGEGQCPPEDIGGITNYCETITRLSGLQSTVEDVGPHLNPSMEKWWRVLNNQIRGKHNVNTLTPLLEFDLDTARTELEIAIRNPKQKSGQESEKILYNNFRTGLSSERWAKPTVAKRNINPIKSCAVCGVTVALKLCSGCNSIAFCSRDHQKQYWPKHKSDCKRMQKEYATNT